MQVQVQLQQPKENGLGGTPQAETARLELSSNGSFVPYGQALQFTSQNSLVPSITREGNEYTTSIGGIQVGLDYWGKPTSIHQPPQEQTTLSLENPASPAKQTPKIVHVFDDLYDENGNQLAKYSDGTLKPAPNARQTSRDITYVTPPASEAAPFNSILNRMIRWRDGTTTTLLKPVTNAIRPEANADSHYFQAINVPQNYPTTGPQPGSYTWTPERGVWKEGEVPFWVEWAVYLTIDMVITAITVATAGAAAGVIAAAGSALGTATRPLRTAFRYGTEALETGTKYEWKSGISQEIQASTRTLITRESKTLKLINAGISTKRLEQLKPNLEYLDKTIKTTQPRSDIKSILTENDAKMILEKKFPGTEVKNIIFLKNSNPVAEIDAAVIKDGKIIKIYDVDSYFKGGIATRKELENTKLPNIAKGYDEIRLKNPDGTLGDPISIKLVKNVEVGSIGPSDAPNFDIPLSMTKDEINIISNTYRSG